MRSEGTSDVESQMEAISARLSDNIKATRLSNGDHAALRRMYLTNRISAIGVTVKLLAEAKIETRVYESDWEAWKLIAHVAALLSGTGRLRSHARWRSFGTALRESQPSSQSSDKRLLRLTAAKDEALRDQVSLAVRLIARTGNGPFNLVTLLDLVGRDSHKAERGRIRIAQDYYAAQARSEGEPK